MNAHKICINIVREESEVSFSQRSNRREDQEVIVNTPVFKIKSAPKLNKIKSTHTLKSKLNR